MYFNIRTNQKDLFYLQPCWPVMTRIIFLSILWRTHTACDLGKLVLVRPYLLIFLQTSDSAGRSQKTVIALQKEQHWLNLLTPNQCKGFQRNKWMPCHLWKLCTYLLWFLRKNPKGMITWALLVFRITNSSPRHLFITTDKTNLHQRAKSRLSTTFKFPKSWENSSTVYFFHIEIWTNL